jgi:ParB family chromosome partitioning protein
VTLKTIVRNVPVASIRRNSRNPRKRFDERALQELAASIREVGVIQPITVVPKRDGKFLLVAGERRWRAAKIAGLSTIPAIVRELSTREIAQIAFIENLQRRDLDPIEEAHAIAEIVRSMRIPADEVAELLGKSVSFVHGRLRLLRLPVPVQNEVAAGRLSPVAANLLTRLDDAAAETISRARTDDNRPSRVHRERACSADNACRQESTTRRQLQPKAQGIARRR